MNNENYNNIGGYSSEKITELYKTLTGNTYNLTSSEKPFINNTDGTNSNDNFYSKNLGCCLIKLDMINSFTLQSSTFNNVWNFDRYTAF